MKKIFALALVMLGFAGMSFAQTTDVAKTKTKHGIVKSKVNGVKTKENLNTKEMKKKDDMAKTKTETHAGKMKPKDGGEKIKPATTVTKTKPAVGSKTVVTKPVTPGPVKKDGTPDKRFTANKKLKKDGTPDMRYKDNKKKS